MGRRRRRGAPREARVTTLRAPAVRAAPARQDRAAGGDRGHGQTTHTAAPTLGGALRGFLVVAVIGTGLFIHLDTLGWKAIPLLAGALALALPLPWLDGIRVIPDGARPRLAWSSAGVFAAAFTPVAVQLSSVWRGEFPYGGDIDYHLYGSSVFLGLVRRLVSWPAFLALVVAVSVAATVWTRVRSGWRYVYLAALLVAYLASFALSAAVDVISRYPGLYYSLTLPLNILASGAAWDSPLDVNRLTNALSVPVWLWVLRPLCLKRWPDARVLPFAVAFLWQKDVVYFFTNTYLEPWALVFIALAVESLVGLPGAARHMSLVWLGLSSMVKESGVFLLPLMAVVLVWKERSPRVTAAAAVACGLPFLTFHLLRSMHYGGGLNYTGLAPILREDNLREWGYRLTAQFGPAGLLMVVGLVAALLACCWVYRRSDQSGALLVSLAGFAFFALFFLVQTADGQYVGYSRFTLFTLVALCAGLIPMAAAVVERVGTRTVVAGAGVLALLNAPALIPFLMLSRGPADGLNSFEHYGAPTHFPVRTLLEPLVRELTAGGRTANVKLAVLYPQFATPQRHYPVLFQRIMLWKAQPTPAGPDCRCEAGMDAVMGIFETPGTLLLGDVRHPEGRVVLERLTREAPLREQCIVAIRTTCRRWRLERGHLGADWGAIGTP